MAIFGRSAVDFGLVYSAKNSKSYWLDLADGLRGKPLQFSAPRKGLESHPMNIYVQELPKTETFQAGIVGKFEGDREPQVFY